MIMTSVIFALAVAQILAGVSRIAQYKSRVRPFFPHSVWTLNLFIVIFLIWWASWEFRSVQWTFPQYAYLLIVPTLLFFACSLLIPQRLEGTEVSMEEHFFRIRRPLFVSYFFAALAAMVAGNLLTGEPLWHEGRFVHVLLLGMAIWAYFSANKNAHKIIAPMSMLAILGLIASRFWIPR